MDNKDLSYDIKKTAFVTLVMLDDGYIPGALLIGYSLRRQNRDFLLICLVTSEVTSYSRELLKLFFDHVIEVDKIYVPCKRMKQTHYLPYVFTKLNALLLCTGGYLSYDLEKVIFLDSDTLPLQNYKNLLLVDAPAGIINEFKSNLIMITNSNEYKVKESAYYTKKWHWHNIYDPICPHGKEIPQYLTDRVKENPKNMGIHGALMIMKPSSEEYIAIKEDLEREETKNEILKYAWPEMQYLTARWSGSWKNIDIKYCGFKGYPSIDLLDGTHFAGIKPWKIMAGKYDLSKMPDYKIWFEMWLEMIKKHKHEFKDYKKGRRLAELIKLKLGK